MLIADEAEYVSSVGGEWNKMWLSGNCIEHDVLFRKCSGGKVSVDLNAGSC